MKYLSLILILIALSACVSVEDLMRNGYNQVRTGQSDFDNTKYVEVNNIYCHDIGFELYQGTNQQKHNKVIVNAGTYEVKGIQKQNSLSFNVDSEVTTFSSVSDFAELDHLIVNGFEVSFYNRKYLIDESFIRKVAAAETVIVRLMLSNDRYYESKCSNLSLEDVQKISSEVTQNSLATSNKFSAQLGFKKFVTLMDTTNW